MEDVPYHERLFMLMGANTRSGRSKGGVEKKGRYTQLESLLTLAANHGVVLVVVFFNARKSGTLRTFKGPDKSRLYSPGHISPRFTTTSKRVTYSRDSSIRVIYDDQG